MRWDVLVNSNVALGALMVGIIHASIATIARKGKLHFRVDSGRVAFIYLEIGR